MKPIVAIVGRPNVGKSRFFNRLVGATRAIVADESGITRDRHYADADWAGRQYIAVDTGGLDLDPAADLEHEISKQSLRAIEEADAVICLFDGQHPPTSDDHEIVNKLRSVKKPVLFAINKVDEASHEAMLAQYHELGAGELFPVSSEHGRGVDDLLDELFRRLPSEGATPDEAGPGLKIAVVGRPNVGKSTLVNRLAGEPRVVVHEKAGTTRDAIDVEVEFDGKKYVFIDTAGVSRRWGLAERVDKFTAMRSLRTIDRADVVLQLIDGREGFTRQDAHLMGFIAEEGKGVVLLINKWDEVKTEVTEYQQNLADALGQQNEVATLPISAKTGYNCLKIFKQISGIEKALSTKISTSALNRVLEEALAAHHMPVHKGKQVKIYYGTQVGVRPPTFALFSNYPAAVPYTYRRYIINKLKDALGVKGIPVRIVMKKK